MAAYLIDNPPAVQQWYKARNRPLTGCTVLHTAEGVLDSIGPDTGAENTARFIQSRTTAGSYHDLVDSDSWVPLIPYQHGAFHDGTGSNNWALSISFACRTSDWRAMSPEKRAGFLHQGARAFAAQQAWRRANGFPLTELRLISKAQSDAGMSGFTYHGLRDPGRRTDPGVAAPNLFPFDEFIDHCRAAVAARIPQQQDGGFLMALTDQQQDDLHRWLGALVAIWTNPQKKGADAEGLDRLRNIDGNVALLLTQAPGGQIDAATLAAAIPGNLAAQVAEELSKRLAD